jgi:hypothetical protein
MKREILIIGLFVVVASPARAQGFTHEQREESLQIALDFAQCAGIEYAMSDIGEETGRDPDQLRMHRERGNGSALAARFVMGGSLLGPEMFAEDLEVAEAVKKFNEAETFIEDQIEMHRAHWRAKIRSGLAGVDTSPVLKCNELMPMQVRIIENMRKERFIAPPIEEGPKPE